MIGMAEQYYYTLPSSFYQCHYLIAISYNKVFKWNVLLKAFKCDFPNDNYYNIMIKV